MLILILFILIPFICSYNNSKRNNSWRSICSFAELWKDFMSKETVPIYKHNRKLNYTTIDYSVYINNRTLANFSFGDNIQGIASSSRGIIEWIKIYKLLILLYLWTHRKDGLYTALSLRGAKRRSNLYVFQNLPKFC